MPDDPFYPPHHQPARPRVPRPGEPLWELRKDGATWSAELRHQGEWGVEAHISKDGDLVIGRIFDLREWAIRWAEHERVALEKGNG